MKQRSVLKPVMSTRFAKTITIPIILIFALVMVAVFFATFTSFVSELKENVHSSKLEQLQSIESSITSRVRELNSISDHMKNDVPFTFAPLKDAQYSNYNITKNLQRLLVGNDFISYLVYYRVSEPDILLTSSGEIGLRSFWNGYVGYPDETEVEYFQTIRTLTDRTIIPMRQAVNGKSYMTIVYPLPLYTRSPKAYVLSYISDTTMDAITRSLFLDCIGGVTIFDLDNNPIYSYTNDERPIVLEEYAVYNQSESTYLQEITLEGVDYLLLKHHSDYNKWDYVSLIRTDEIMSGLNSKQTGFMLYLLAILLVAIVAVIAAALISYRPINSLAQRISSLDLGTNVSNEQQLLKDTISTLLERTQSMTQDLFLSNLIAQQYDEVGLQMALQECGIYFEHTHYLACALYFPDCATQKPDSSVIELISSHFDRSDIQCNLIYRTNPSHLLLLINSTADILAWDAFAPVLSSLYYDLSEEMKIIVSVGVGSLRGKLSEVPISAHEATDALYSCILEDSGFIMRCQDIDIENTTSVVSGVTAHLLSVVRKGQAEKVQTAMQELDVVCARNQVSSRHRGYIIYDILSSLKDEVDLPSLSDEINALLHTLLNRNISNIQMVMAQVETLCAAIAAHKSQSHADRGEALINTICQTISDNLCDNMLSLESISHSCGISPSYLSRYFKSHMGCTPMQYVEHRRMDLVKEMLCNTDMLLKDILSKTGYIDQSNFIRKFKKQEGVTPMTYRKLNSGKGEPA